MYEERIQWINHKGKKVLSCNYSDLAPNDLDQLKSKIINIMVNEPLHSVLSIVDGTNLHFGMKVMSYFSDLSAECDPYFKAIAVVGVTGLVRVMYDGVAKFSKTTMKTFNNKEGALNWLINL